MKEQTLPRLARGTLLGAWLACTLAGTAMAAEDTKPVADFGACPKPEWPKESLRQGQHGAVTLQFLIGVDGAIRDARVQRSSGYPLLDMAAQEGIRRCRFKPGTKDGQPVEAWMSMQYVWTLDSSPQYDEATIKAMREAAAGGAPDAVMRLVRLQMMPASPAYDPAAALAGLRKLAATGNAAAREMLGMSLLAGRYVTPDPVEARKLLADAAADGLPAAQYALSGLLLNGAATADDLAAGERWLRLAALGGYTKAQTRLGSRLVQRPEHTEEGVDLLRKAAAKNDRFAQAALGRCFETATGVQRDYAQALAQYTLAAATGNADAKRGLARLYEQGNGVPRDTVAARKLYEEADHAEASAR